MLDFPGTLRMDGPESNSALNYTIGPMVYETLLDIHPTTLDYISALATHWQISADKTTYRFRINPNARWADGQPVTADDVVATWAFRMDKGLQDPSSQMTFGKFEKPVAESKYIVRVKSKRAQLAQLPLLLRHVDLPGSRAEERRRRRLPQGLQLQADSRLRPLQGRGSRRRRRARASPSAAARTTGPRSIDATSALYNFDEIREIVVRDQKLAFEMFKKGDLDDYYVNVRGSGSRS